MIATAIETKRPLLDKQQQQQQKKTIQVLIKKKRIWSHKTYFYFVSAE